jgi:hypothetical protein
LEDKYNIEVTDYFNLSAKERNYLAILVVHTIFYKLKSDKMLVPVYIHMVNKHMKESELLEEFELADLYKRIKRELFNFSIEP